MIDKDYLLPRS